MFSFGLFFWFVFFLFVFGVFLWGLFFLYLTLTWSKPEPEVFVNVPILLSEKPFCCRYFFGSCFVFYLY